MLNSTQDLIAQATGPVQSFAKSTILKLLQRVEKGQIEIHSNGEVLLFGSPYVLETPSGPSQDLKAKLTVLDESFWTRLFMHADFGFADAYMLGHIDVDSLNSIFRIFVLNRKKLGELDSIITPVFRLASYIANTRLANRTSSTKGNMSAHYDLSNRAFAGFMSYEMTYSCAIFPDEANGPEGDLWEARPMAPPRPSPGLNNRTSPPDDLEKAQLHKLDFIAKRARVFPGARVLDIGCGWGSLSIFMAQKYGAIVDAITISDHQKAYLDARIEAEGLSHVITTYLMDYRDMPESFHHAFDSVISLGVMEHVGLEYMQAWFEKMSWAMKPENSFKVFAITTVPDTRWAMYSSEVDFIRKYIYPGGQLSSIKTLVNDAVAAGLNVESIENIGPHYARTLREWSYRFVRNWDSHIKPAMLEEYPALEEADLEIFRRKWMYYFAYSESGFALRSISDHIIVVSREANLRV